MMRYLGTQTAIRWLPVLAMAPAAAALGCGTAASPSGTQRVEDPARAGPASGWTPAYVKLGAADGDPNQDAGMVFRIHGRWLAMLAQTGSASPGPDAVYLFERAGERWERRQRLVAPDGHAEDGFGTALDLTDSTLVVGAPAQRDRGVRSGIVHVFERRTDQWAPVATLSSPDPVEDGGFGHHVAIDGQTLVVGEDRKSEGWPRNKAAYVFVRDGASWRPQTTITMPADLPAPNLPTDSPAFGYYFDLDGSSLAIAAPGVDIALLYERSGNGWVRHQTLEHPSGRLRDPRGRTNQRGGAFGRTLDLDGDVLVVGALRADGDAPDAGAAYVYRRLQGAWHLEDRLVARDGATNDMFGHWVAHDRGLIVSGAFRHRVGGHPEIGAAYLYARRRGDWQLTHKLIVPDQPRRLSSYMVDVHGGTAVLSGGRLEGSNTGWLYVVDVGGAGPPDG
jgi:hypothetical protein